MLRTRKKRDHLKNIFFHLDEYRNNRVVRCIQNVLHCPDMIINNFELNQTMPFNTKLKTVNSPKYIYWRRELRLSSQNYGSARRITARLQ